MSYKDMLTELEANAPGEYQKSDTVLAAQKALSDYEATKPQDYQSKYTEQLDGLLDQLGSRKFDYDFNQDALYKQYRDRYVEQGRQAAADAAADTAALTGGYGSTAATSAAAQANQQYLLGLNDVIPDLYNLALARYQQEGQDLTELYGLTKSADDTDYSRYTDKVNDWYNYLNYLNERENTEYNRDYTQYGDTVSRYNTDRAYAYQGYRDDEAAEQWEREFAESQRQYNESLALQQAQFDYQKQQDAAAAAQAARSAAVSSYSGSGTGSSGTSKKSSSSSKKSSSTASNTYVNQFKQIQNAQQGWNLLSQATSNAPLTDEARANAVVKGSALTGATAKTAYKAAQKTGVSDSKLNSIMKKYYE